MEQTVMYISLSFLFIFITLKLLLRRKSYRNLPPSPPALPIIGHLHLLKIPLHRYLHRLSEKHGPIVYLRFGSRDVVLISSQETAEECFTKNDIVLANRPNLLMFEHIGYDYTSVFASPYGEHWRNLRRISTLEIFSTNRLNMFLGIRKQEIKLLLRKLCLHGHENFAKVELKSLLSELSFNIITRMVAGKRYYGHGATDLEEAREFREIIKEITKLGEISTMEDFIPILKWISYQGVETKYKKLRKRVDSFLQELIDEHQGNSNSRLDSRNTMVDHLLSLKETEPEVYTDQIIKGLLLTMITAGTDTTSVTIEWAMSLLLNSPHVLKKSRIEIDTVVGQDRLIDEPDLSKLPYLKSIVLETLRLFPAAPLLLPHKSSSHCTVGGFDVPSGTMLLVNAWAIHRDWRVWEDPMSFKPERFENGEGDQHQKLLAFGMGRRACPGAGLANRVVSLALGSLIQCFEWEGIGEVNFDEGIGITMPKAEPLEALCRARQIVNNAF